jgi:zinc transport system substrate-binding protein
MMVSLSRSFISLQVAMLISVGLLTACEQTPESNTQSVIKPVFSASLPANILTVNYPLQYFTQRIGGEFIAARYPGPPGKDPAYWKPGIDTVLDYQQADLIVLNGIGYANWIQQVSLPLGKQVDTSADFSDRLLPVADNVAHTHGPQGDHVHDDMAFTVWLDPQLATLQTRAIHSALLPLLPNQQELLDVNLQVLTEELQMLDNDLAQAFGQRKGRQIIYSHPVYQYLDHRYDLKGFSVHWEPDAIPSANEFAQLENMSGAVMIWEAEPLPEVSAKLSEMGITSVVFNTCATQPDSGSGLDNYLHVMQENIEQIKNTLR